MGKFKDISGQRFGRLTAIKVVERGQYVKWLCKCDCGNETIVRGTLLRYGSIQSCGCLQSDISKGLKNGLTHGMSYTRQHSIWSKMKERCNNPSNKRYSRYGGRGIKVCEKWSTFEGFWDDMHEGYSDELTLDRIDNNKGYCKDNCRWATIFEQANNKCNNVIYTAFGVTDTAANLCRKFNADYALVMTRMRVYKVGIEEAILKPSEHPGKRHRHNIS